MKLDTITLAFILSLILGTQIIALFAQYRANRSYRGIGCWILGSSLMALGFMFMPMLTVKSLEILARIANPLVVLGHTLLYIGTIKFLNKKLNRWIPIWVFLSYSVSYYYYMYINNDVTARTIIVTATMAIISFMIAHQLFFKNDKFISEPANFTAAVFFIYGCFYTVRAFWEVISPHTQSNAYQTSILMVGFIVSILISNLWTFGLIIMVNQRLNIENQLEKEKMKLIFNTSSDAQFITQFTDGFFVDVNDGFSVLIGYTRGEVIGVSMLKFNLWYNIEDRQSFITELNDKKTCENREFLFLRKDKSQFIGMISARIIMIHDVPHIISVIRDITESKQLEEALIESEEKYRSILNASPDNITITDLDGRILIISPTAKKMFGYDPDFDNFVGMQILDFIVPEDVEKAQANIRRMYQGGNLRSNEYRGVRQDRSNFDIEVNSGIIYSANGQPAKMVFIIRDITERKLTERKIQELIQQLEIEKNTAQRNSITDSLTGLPNRRYFDESLKTEFFRSQRSGTILSLIMIDIDYFKKFNDSYGHLAGDECLRLLGTTLKIIVRRATDIVARYGGEEFVIILPETDKNQAKILGERVRKAVEDLAIPHSASGIADYVTISLGVVSIYTTELASPKQLLSLADEALYCAKRGGRNRCCCR